MLTFDRKPPYHYEDLLYMIRLLRHEGGCPWDGAQTHQTIRRGLLEEAYETAEAIDLDDAALMREELGDLLMQVVFHADIEQDAGRFTMDDVCDGVVRKLLYRHPHVFGTERIDSADDVPASWEQVKRAERGQTTTAQAMASVSRALPSTWRAEKIQNKAAADGFDWADVDGALAKLAEEVDELRRAAKGDGDAAEELGDLLFAAVKVGRFLGLDAETALHGACDKFIARYDRMEHISRAENRQISQHSLDELLQLWDNAKRE